MPFVPESDPIKLRGSSLGENLPLHLKFLLKYLQGDTSAVENLPPRYTKILQAMIENPQKGVYAGYMPALTRPFALDPTSIQETRLGAPTPENFQAYRALGYRPSLSTGPVAALYTENPDSWRQVMGGSDTLQLARSFGAFSATPDTARRMWTVKDRYQFDAIDEGRQPPEGEKAPSTWALLAETPTFLIPRLLHGRGKPFDIKMNIPMSDSAYAKLQNFVKTGQWE